MKIYYTKVYPRLIYRITVWGGSFDSALKSIRFIQNRLIRAISAEPTFQRLNLFKLGQMDRYMIPSYVLKSLYSSVTAFSSGDRDLISFIR